MPPSSPWFRLIGRHMCFFCPPPVAAYIVTASTIEDVRQGRVERNLIAVNLFSVNYEICLVLSQSWSCMLEAKVLKMHSTPWFKINVEFPSRQEAQKEEKLLDKSVSFPALLHSAQKPWCKMCFSNLSRLERGKEKC